MKQRKLLYIVLILLSSLFLGYFDLPDAIQKNLVPFTPSAISDSKIHLGLDLQGGAQLDYKIDMRSVPDAQRESIINGILNVINKRVNSLGVSEPNIYTSDFGDEKHIVVELAGVKDLDKAKELVGKTIQLEFKEQKENTEDPNYEQEVKTKAEEFARLAKNGDMMVLGKEEELANPGKVFFHEVTEFKYKDEVDSSIADKIFALNAGETSDLIENANTYTVDASGNIVPGPKSFAVLKITEKRDQERKIDTPRSVDASHILIAFKGAQKADSSIERTEEEAKNRAEEVLKKINEGGNFAELAKEYSDDKDSKDNGGKLSDPVIKDGNLYAKEFETAATDLQKEGDLSATIKSPFGFHIIKADKINDAKSETKVEPQVKYAETIFSAAPDPWQETGLNGKHFTRANVMTDPQSPLPYVSIQFNSEGSKLFEDITRRNVGKPLAIFVGGQLISAPQVNEVIAGGTASIDGEFTFEQASNLARDLNTGAIPAPIVLTGQYSIGATLGQDALSSSIYAGIIGLLILALFMILYYRIPGFIATVTLGIYSVILIFLIKVAMPIIWALLISVALFIFLIYKLLQSRESGVEKTISAVLVTFVLFFFTFLLATPIVLTLAGIAGVVLSIGMAVDANILIFERVKEELRDGRPLSAAIEVGFDRAWNSIRDSNFSSLITCAILFYFGSSIIQGFAFNLAAGILVSMFTAITITKTFLIGLSSTSLAKKTWLFGIQKSKNSPLIDFIKNRKIFYGISTALIILALICMPIFGIRLGLDFTGGTLMEIQMQDKNVTVEQIRSSLLDSQESVNNAKDPDDATQAESETSAPAPSDNAASTANNTMPAPVASEAPAASEEASAAPVNTSSTTETIHAEHATVDLNRNVVIPSETGFIIKLPHITNAQHDVLLESLKAKFPGLEETRFSTVGPTVGQNLQTKAISAVLIAALMIVLYIAIAFRRVPRYIGKWKFGLTAIAALVHDLLIMIGAYVLLGAFLNVEIDALFITAMLTVLGFSVHDTIVVFDRLREKLKFQKREETFADVANQAVNETLARSINTSLSTLIVLLAMFLWGAISIKFFIFSLIVGIISGTYSSIFIATPLLVDWNEYTRNENRQSTLKPKKAH